MGFSWLGESLEGGGMAVEAAGRPGRNGGSMVPYGITGWLEGVIWVVGGGDREFSA